MREGVKLTGNTVRQRTPKSTVFIPFGLVYSAFFSDILRPEKGFFDAAGGFF
jgi:hypothetical protein